MTGTPQARVRIGPLTLKVAAVLAAPHRFRGAFMEARARTGYAECLCRPDAPLRLVIRLRDGRFHLACWPEEGPRHHPRCRFFDSGLSGRALKTAALTATDDGTDVALAIPLMARVAAGGRTSRPRPAPPGSEAGSGSRLGLLGLMHYLWETAGLTRLRPEEVRTWRSCHQQIANAVAATTTERRIPLGRLLYPVPPWHERTASATAQAFTAFTGSLGVHGTQERFGMLLGEIKDITPGATSWKVALRYQRDRLFADTALLRTLQKSYPAAFAAEPGPGARRMLLALVGRTARGFLTLLDGAAMLATSRYLPVDSSYELQLANRLAELGRPHSKPLTWAADAATLPDFVLHDTDPATLVEVYGVRGRSSYDRRKAAKREHYAAQQVPVIEWDVAAGQPMPPLHPPRLHPAGPDPGDRP